MKKNPLNKHQHNITKYVMSAIVLLLMVGMGFDFYLTRIRLPRETTLVSGYSEILPVVDGEIESAWQKALPLRIALHNGSHPVPNVEMRALHNRTHISFLLQWQDDSASMQRQPWVSKERQWQQQTDGSDENNFAEDKLALIFPIQGSIFANNGCASTCHTAVMGKNYGAKFAPGKELLDLWQWGSVTTNPLGRMDDMFVDSQQATPQNLRGGIKYDFFFNEKNKNKMPQEISLVEWLNIRGWAENKTQQNIPAYFARSPADDLSLSASKEDENILLLAQSPHVSSVVYAKNFRSPIAAKGRFADGKWTLEIQRLRVTQDVADLQLRPQTHHYLFSLAVFNNSFLRHSYSEKIYRLAFDDEE